MNISIRVKEFEAAEAALAEAQRRHHALINAMGAAVYTTDADGRLTFYNEAAVTLWGCRPALGDARFCGAWRLYAADGAPMRHDECPMAVSLRENRPIFGSEAVAERPDGTRVAFAAYPTPLRDPSGAVTGAVNVLVDVTGRKVAEAALRRSDHTREALGRQNEALEDRVREEVQAREAAQFRLAQAQRMEALGRLAGGMAHDFNNVLQAVQGSLALIARHPDDVDGARRHARMGLEAAVRGSSVTQRLLLFARRGELRAEVIDPRKLLAELGDMLSHTLGTAIELRTAAPPGLPLLQADRGQLETVLVNLATNARDAMPAGGILTFAAASEAVAPNGQTPHRARLHPGRYVRLDVSDTGIGMDAATLTRISEPFFTTKAVGAGTGLGIAMAQGFVEQSGGDLRIVSEQGIGTTVMFWLPVATADAALPPADPRADPPVDQEGETRTNLLLVDDDQLVRETLSEQLEQEGYGLLAAGSGPLALGLLDAGETVDLLVSDFAMPEMNGLAVIHEAQRRRPGLPAILLTGHAEDVVAFAGSGAARAEFSLLRKPVTTAELAERINSLLRMKRTQAAGAVTKKVRHDA